MGREELYGSFLNVPGPDRSNLAMKRFLPFVLPFTIAVLVTSSAGSTIRAELGARTRKPSSTCSTVSPSDRGRAMSSGSVRLGVDRYIDQQLHPERVADPGMAPAERALASIGMSSREIARDVRAAAAQGAARAEAERDRPARPERRRNRPIRSSRRPTASSSSSSEQKVLRAIYSERQLQEVLTDFWFNHFNVDARKGPRSVPADRVRARDDPTARARQVPRSAGGDRQEPGDAVLSRQLDERRSERAAHGDAAAARRTRSVRRPRAMSARGTRHAGRRARTHRRV